MGNPDHKQIKLFLAVAGFTTFISTMLGFNYTRGLPTDPLLISLLEKSGLPEQAERFLKMRCYQQKINKHCLQLADSLRKRQDFPQAILVLEESCRPRFYQACVKKKIFQEEFFRKTKRVEVADIIARELCLDGKEGYCPLPSSDPLEQGTMLEESS